MRKIIFIFISVVLSFGFSKAQLPVGPDTITVIEGGNVLKSAWAGGLNFCSVSQVDLNLDGKKDLVLFDKVDLFAYGILRCFINKGGVGEVNYVYSGEYTSKFPAVQQWAVFHDYDNDGLGDLFTYVLGGIAVYHNTSTPGNLSFQMLKPVLRAIITPTNPPAMIYSSPVSIPGFSDIDSDGDLDLLTFSSSGYNLEYYKNWSVETYGNDDSLFYKIDEYTWGNISENGCLVSLNQFIGNSQNNNLTEKILHSGSCIMCMDRDNDGDKDLILGDISCSTLHYLENGGTVANAHMVDTTKLYPNYPNKASTQVIRMNQFPCTYYADIDNDNKKDIIASPNTTNSENFKSVWYYRDASSTPTVNFQFVKDNFLQDDMIEVGEGAFPCLLDVDNDGLLDLLIGNHGFYSGTSNQTRVAYYRNTGTSTLPTYSLITRDFENISSHAFTNALIGLVPSVGDIDGDGDNDLIMADYFGKIHWLENTAGAGNPCNFSVFKNNYFGITTSFPATYPQVIDVNRDGVLDLIVGLRNGKIAYYRNTGTTTTPSFTLVTNSFGNVDVTGDPGLYSTDGSAAPFMFDVSGSYKLLVGSISGRIFYYDNIDGNLSGSFNRIDTNVNKINVGPRSALQYIDVNGDAKRDLIVGNYGGGLSFFSSKYPIGISELSSQENAGIVVYPNPAHEFIEIKSENNFVEKMNIEVFDVVGKLIQSHTVQSAKLRMNTDDISQGVYFFRITTFVNKQKQTVTKKIIIQ